MLKAQRDVQHKKWKGVNSRVHFWTATTYWRAKTLHSATPQKSVNTFTAAFATHAFFF